MFLSHSLRRPYRKGIVEPVDPFVDNQTINEKIAVRCQVCHEIFQREIRNLKYLHSCPIHLQSEGMKWCSACHQYVSTQDFEKSDTYDGFADFCLPCQWALNNFKWNDIADKLAISPNELYRLYIDQRGRCYLTDDDLILMESSNWGTKICISTYFDGQSLALINSTSNYDNLPRFEMVIGECGQMPYRRRTTDAGYDLYASESILLHPMQVSKIDTDIAICPPEGFYFHIEGRSSLLANGIWPLHATIDATFTGSLFVNMINLTPIDYMITRGERIAQIVVHKIQHVDFVQVSKFSPTLDARRNNGLGSTGR